MENLTKIRKAMTDHNTINMTYRKKATGKSVASVVKDYQHLEPYEIRGDRMWAYDPVTSGIKQFILNTGNPDDGVLFVKINETKFEPKYVIKVE